MKRSAFVLMALGLLLGLSAPAFAQTPFYCVKPDGLPLATIITPLGLRDDPSVVCNAVIAQCNLTCAAVEHLTIAGYVVPPNLPVVTVTPEMLPTDRNQYMIESPAYCAQQYQACTARCGGDQACLAACKSVRSGCGRGNAGDLPRQ
ncbi:hypothetical protein [Desulfovibrio sp. TomC]|uniref:hypothetical protein n=1 Tax=Desulfovibrio sp. TomC TaxID=1562888 RepID=UPI0005736944|nr:hypothetical protein [Desulfovibrio sp. TomC]KHK02566.1 hypothetical protein NY78_1923 [Desulfovibrio sp. TomC]